MNRIVLGKFGKTHGIKGWINVNTYTESPEVLATYAQTWWIKISSEWKTLIITDHALHNDQLLVKVDGYDSPEDAKILTHQEIYLSRNTLPTPEQDEYYWIDLEGLLVIDQNNNILGTIDHLFNNGAHDIVVIKTKTQQDILLPYVDSVVTTVDLDKKHMHVNWETPE